MAEFLTALSNAGNFTRDDFALVYRAKNKDATESSCRFVLQSSWTAVPLPELEGTIIA